LRSIIVDERVWEITNNKGAAALVRVCCISTYTPHVQYMHLHIDREMADHHAPLPLEQRESDVGIKTAPDCTSTQGSREQRRTRPAL